MYLDFVLKKGAKHVQPIPKGKTCLADYLIIIIFH